MRWHSVIMVVVLCVGTVCRGDSFREHWAAWDHRVSNLSPRERLRVNDPGVSLHKDFGKRHEARANGLQLIAVPEDLFALERAELYLAMWGGHPKTAKKRFFLNGRGPYMLPDDGVQAGHCAYSYPTISLKISHLVSGVNAFQFACDRGETFWGHYIIDELAVRCYLRSDHPDLVRRGLQEFQAQVRLEGDGRILSDRTHVSLAYPNHAAASILTVEYFGYYFGYDDTGRRGETGWHGYTRDRVYKNHIGTASEPPFAVVWDTRFIPDQKGPMRLKALVRLKSGLNYWTPAKENLKFGPGRGPVRLYRCDALPVPFWSRADRVKRATITLPEDLAGVTSARLLVRIWDGGEGTRKADHFQINGHPYRITSGRSVHDVVFTEQSVDLGHLKPGKNQIMLISDTQHHGIEVCLPGPCLIMAWVKGG